MKHKTLPRDKAKGYTVITHDYNPNSPKDMDLLDKAIADMQGTNFVLVDSNGKIAIARAKKEVKGL
jgi:phosphosulfolactate phosphohydrolase-like enzyme